MKVTPVDRIKVFIGLNSLLSYNTKNGNNQYTLKRRSVSGLKRIFELIFERYNSKDAPGHVLVPSNGSRI